MAEVYWDLNGHFSNWDLIMLMINDFMIVYGRVCESNAEHAAGLDCGSLARLLKIMMSQEPPQHLMIKIMKLQQ
jgi:hypothetical protein